MAIHAIIIEKIEIGTYGTGPEFWTNEEGAMELGDGIIDVTDASFWSDIASVTSAVYVGGSGWQLNNPNPNDANSYNLDIIETALLQNTINSVDPDFLRVTVNVTGALTDLSSSAQYKLNLAPIDEPTRYAYTLQPSGSPANDAFYTIATNGDASDIQKYVFTWGIVTNPPAEPPLTTPILELIIAYV